MWEALVGTAETQIPPLGLKSSVGMTNVVFGYDGLDVVRNIGVLRLTVAKAATARSGCHVLM